MAQDQSAAAPTDSTLPKAYDPTEAEARWYRIWNDEGLFSPKSEDSLPAGSPPKKPYVVMMPPPNVTGTLHNGHALFVTLQDVLIRHRRMRGENALWLPGTDHAGIATQAVVERELKRHEGKSRHDIGRDAFLDRVWAFKEKNGNRIIEQLKVMGASADWSRCRFTMDDQCNRAVKEAFVRMWDDGLIYRGERLVNWDPITHTALSDEEVDHEERDGELWEFAYKVKGEADREIVVATTRPETMLGDTAVAVHPDDDRYTDLVGKALEHPFFPERHLPVVADAYVDREFGTGAVKITPAHDPNDFDIGQRHSLQMINIFTLDARVNENGGPFSGQDRFEARKSVKAALAEKGLERGTQAIKHNVSISQRSHEPIEPMLSRQYFVDAKPLAEKAMAAVDSGETRIIPEGWVKTWNHFMGNIRDWCISRQLWWGHRIPVFYDLTRLDDAVEADAKKKGKTTEAKEAKDAGKPKEEVLKIALATLDEQLIRDLSLASIENLTQKEPGRYVQEEDVLDTWFSSGLWPFSTLGWPDDTDDLRAFYPGAVLETGFDILFFWVARMMMMGIYFMGKAPFSDVYLHAMVRDSHGRKMSKSLGNAIDPLDVIQGITLDALTEKTKTYPVPEKLLPKVLDGLKKEYPKGIPESGADGLRFTLSILSGAGRDIKLNVDRVAGYRAFLNKIWNASRFALMRVGEGDIQGIDAVKGDLSLADQWILSRLQRTVEKVDQGLLAYRFDDASDAIYQFFWSEFCDWYIELAKTSLADDAPAGQREACRAVLVHVLDTSMRLMHPFCPFQSEEIWQKLPGNAERWAHLEKRYCCVAPFPEADVKLINEAAEGDMAYLQSAIVMVRNARQESNLPAQKRVPAIYLTDDQGHRTLLSTYQNEIQRLALLEAMEVEARTGFEVPKHAATNASSDLEVVVPLEGLIDLDAEKKRLEKELAKAEKEQIGLNKRLDNPNFRDKAPPEVVEQAQANLLEIAEKVGRIKKAIERVS
jgi:valyl-tRNA synthetase